MSKDNVIARSHVELCIFCAKNKATSHEHILAAWVQEYFKKIGFKLPKNTQFTKTNGNGEILQTDIVKADDATAPLLCTTCNKKWGSNIQTRASQILKPFISGEWNHLDIKQISCIVQWFTSYDMVRELVHDGHETYTQEERLQFRKDLKIPDTLTIWMAPIKPSNYPHSNNRPIVDLIVGNGITPSIHLTILELRNIVFVAFYSKLDGFMNPMSPVYYGIQYFMQFKGFVLIHSADKRRPISFPEKKPDLAHYEDFLSFLKESEEPISNLPYWYNHGFCQLDQIGMKILNY